ncbi:hypothetical protein G3580_18465 [Nitrogeniibacter mangrovi]|uniref:Uncharacterized protein n=1 Tax=Nitrogeniibacter mangrovi TaxID=2016596 RepID=A0A6C1B9A9_9RHOO|nr:hypothetical protein [Nitrogeniibacter mangrovi]QID19425.1 hypothetical protein G3580_18465 [Nitrogeniibacter mangrovi]
MTTYAIIFKGELRDGFVRDAVMAAFRERANLTAAQVEQVFSGAKVTLKKGLTRDEAKRFARDMRALGMHVLAAAPRPWPPRRRKKATASTSTARSSTASPAKR